MRSILLLFGFLITVAVLPAAAQNGRTLYSSYSQKLAAAWNPNDNRVAFGDDRGQVWIWDAIADTMIKTITAPTGAIYSIQWRPGRNEVVYAGYSSISIWDPANDSVQTLSDNDSPVASIACSPDGMKVACACGTAHNKSFRIWDVPQEKLLLTLDTAYEGSGCSDDFVLWTPDGSGLLADGGCGWDGTIYDPANGAEMVHLDTWFGNQSIGSTIRSASFSPDGKELATGHYGDLINVFDTKTWSIRRQIAGQGLGYENVLAWSPGGNLLADGDRSGRISVWNAKTSFQINAFQGHAKGISAVAWSPDGRHLMTAGLDGSVKIWDAADILSAVPAVTQNESEISVSPMPAASMLHVRLAAAHAEPMAFSLIDMSGRIVIEVDREIQAGSDQVNLDVSGMPTGAYFLVARHSNGQAQRQIVQVAH